MLYFSRHIPAGVGFDGDLHVMMLGSVTEDPLVMSDLKNIYNEHSCPGIKGE